MIEISIDGIVGPTHHFGGLGVGNVASIAHQDQSSHPRQAALEGLRKAWLVASMGVPQYVFLPPVRPRLDWLAELGFEGSLAEQLSAVRNAAPRALSAAFSSAFMWMANAATVTASTDSIDGRLHCTPANLISSWHRGSEAQERKPQLESLLAQINTKNIHSPLPAVMPLRDEGAANHMRLCDSTGTHGFNLFVHGSDDDTTHSVEPRKFIARHTQAASQAIARLHQLPRDRTFFLHQHPAAIDAGVFHNDVIATSCDHMLLHHEFAFVNAEQELQRLETQFEELCQQPLLRVQVNANELPLADAVRSYFFNSQVIKPRRQPGQDTPRFVLICPHHCQEVLAAAKLIERLVADPRIPIDEVHFVQLAESMANGGGPACLRLRMMVSEDEASQLNPRLKLTESLFDRLSKAIDTFYPAALSASDLCSVDFVESLQQVDRALQATMELD